MNGDQKSGYFARTQNDLNLHILRMIEGAFSLDGSIYYKYTHVKIEFCSMLLGGVRDVAFWG